MQQFHFTPDPSNLPQQYALELVRDTSESFFLTGKAGTGKSTLLRYITEHTHKRHVVLASTGIAALNVRGQTIHSFFKLPIRPILPNDPDLSTERNRIYEVFRYTKSHKELIRSLELIIIDEISMVRADVIDAIDRLLRVYRGHMHMPFGGVQMLFVGDLFQLEPVAKADERQILDKLYRSHFFFDAKVFETSPIVGVELQQVYRQADPVFVGLLDRIRSGGATTADIQLLNQRVQRGARPNASDLVITLSPRRDDVASINEHCLSELDTVLFTHEGVVEGEFGDSNLPTDRTLRLKVGAQVIFRVNDRERRWVNGTIGTVEGIDLEEGYISVRLEDGMVHRVELYAWEHVRYDYDEEKHEVVQTVMGRFVQYPLQLAWAITIHKSQGLTFDRVIIDFGRGGAFAGGQAYVALSRCRSLEGTTLSAPISLRDMITRSAVSQFYQTMNDPTLIQGVRDRAEAQQGYLQANKLWTAQRYTEAITALGQAIEVHNELSNPLYLRMLKRKLMHVDELASELQAARQELAEGRKLLRGLATEHCQMGDECLSLAKDAEAALRCYAKALAFDPKSIPALVGRSRAYQYLGDMAMARAALAQARQLSPLAPDVLLALGKLSVSERMWDEALEPLLTLIGHDREHTEAIDLVITCYERLDQDDEAELFRRLRHGGKH